MIKIRQSYHGDGSMLGYLYEVFNSDDTKIGYLDNVPTKLNTGNIIKINNKLCEIVKIYDCTLPESEVLEVIWYELENYEFKPDYDLGNIK